METSLFAEANRRLDENDFSESIALFRKAIMISEPTRGQLLNMWVAEDEDRLQFRRTMCELYPESVNCKLNLARMLHRVGHSGLAVLFASKLMSETTLGEVDLFRLRRIRLDSAIAAKIQDFVIQDFSAIWKAAVSFPAGNKCRKGIISDLASVSAPEFSIIFDELSVLSFLEEEVAAFLRAKARELEAVGKLVALLR